MIAMFAVSWPSVGWIGYRLARVTPATSPAAAADPTPAAAPPTTAPAWSRLAESAAGAWGKFETVPIVLELPKDYASVAAAIESRSRWHFAGKDRAAALGLMRECGFTDAQLTAIGGDAWRDEGGSSSVDPSDALVLSLSPAARGALYAALMSDPANKSAVDPSWFRVGRVDFRVRGGGLSEASTELLKRLLYAGDADTLLFNDLKVALRAIDDPAERLRFMSVATRKRAVVARLHVDVDSDTQALANYWGRGGREAAVLPLLNSLKFNAIAGVERPSRINVVAILPPFVQERLYRHSDGTHPAGREPDDCFWTTFNFFSKTPDERVQDPAYLAALLNREYVRIDAPSQLGDVILIADANGDAVHAANYIADDLVFTKNGTSVRQPWILSTMHDMLTQYRMKRAELQVVYFRRR